MSIQDERDKTTLKRHKVQQANDFLTDFHLLSDDLEALGITGTELDNCMKRWIKTFWI